jgi:hypothetical protein
MRLPRSWIAPISRRIIEDLLKKGYVELILSEEKTLKAAEQILIDELRVEDQLNEEVREILRKHSDEIDYKRLDYKRLFDMTKKKLVRERNLIL